MTHITLLGTSSMVPTKERNVQGIYLEHKGEGMLFDCGEGTQRQMNICGLNRNKIRKIMITHWHGDHAAGLIGLLQTIGHNLTQQEDKPALTIYGPKGTKEHMHHLLRATVHEQGKIALEIKELPTRHHKFFENDEYELWCAPLKHSTECMGYSFKQKDARKIDMRKAQALGLKPGRKIGLLQRGETIKEGNKTIEPDMVGRIERGKKFTLIADTGECNEAITLAEDSDLLVIEATFSKEHEERAQTFKHLTAEQAAGIAQRAGVDSVVLTHFSQRYTDLQGHLDEAQTIHPNTRLGYDFMKLEL